MKKVTGAESGLTIEELELLCKGKFSQFKKAAKSLFINGFYRRGHSFAENKGKIDIYFLNDDRLIETLCYNVTPRRSKVLLSALNNSTINNVSDSILGNYKTNGFTTRRGLFANYSSKEERIKKIANSHALINDCHNSTSEHNVRVYLRN